MAVYNDARWIGKDDFGYVVCAHGANRIEFGFISSFTPDARLGGRSDEGVCETLGWEEDPGSRNARCPVGVRDNSNDHTPMLDSGGRLFGRAEPGLFERAIELQRDLLGSGADRFAVQTGEGAARRRERSDEPEVGDRAVVGISYLLEHAQDLGVDQLDILAFGRGRQAKDLVDCDLIRAFHQRP